MEVLQRTANRGSISSALYSVANSVKLDKGNDSTTVEFFERNVSSAGSRTTGTFSAWVKKTDVTTAQYLFTFGNVDNDNGRTFARFQTDGTLRIGGGSTTWLNTNRVFRDVAAWYHIVVAIDTTSGTADNRIRIYVNGVEETSFGTRNNPSQNDVMGTNFGKQAIGYNTIDNNSGFNGYMCEVVIQDGVASAPTEFGEFDSASGIWIPKDASGATMGTNGTYLKFENASSMGAATAGNAFTVQNINQNDQATDVPTNNFATLSPLMANAGPANYLPITEGGTKAVNAAAAYKIANSTFGVTSGKWYWEVKATDVNGVTAIGVTMPFYWDADYTLQGCIYYGQTGQRYNNASAGSFGATYAAGDIISFALDMDATPPTMTVFKNNSSQGNLMAGLSINGTGGAFLPPKEDGYFPKVVGYSVNTFDCNFGGFTNFSISSAATDENGYGTFEYAPPTGYYALCTKNLAEYG